MFRHYPAVCNTADEDESQKKRKADSEEKSGCSSTGSLYIGRIQCANYSFLLKENANCLHNVGTCNEREAAGFCNLLKLCCVNMDENNQACSTNS